MDYYVSVINCSRMSFADLNQVFDTIGSKHIFYLDQYLVS